MWPFFMNTIIVVFQFKHLISKTTGLDISKMWSTIFVSSKLTEILENLYKGTEFLPQIMILQSPYLFNRMVQTFDISNYHYLI